jgi:phosphoglycolate phosphatase-like HAD superfamily hydrolase
MGDVHIVWDWNGTLLADLPYVLDAVSRSIGRYGLPPIDGDDYRDHFTRPVRLFYNSMFGREITDMEWADLNKTFHDYYYEVVDDIELAPGARSCLDRVADQGWSQSLLSMSTHTQLNRTVAAHGIAHLFRRIDGLVTADGGLKSTHLKAHLAAMNLRPESVFLVGDTPDDHAAASSVGAGIVLYDGGSHHRHDLDILGAPVAETLPEAISIIRSGLSG